jgi:hypothetical protein
LGLDSFSFVMAGLVPAIHVFLAFSAAVVNSWMPGTSAGHDNVSGLMLVQMALLG